MVIAKHAAVTLREMRATDIPAARELSRDQQWPHRTSDWTFMFQQGSGVVAEQDGRVVGTTMSWLYGTDAATVGLVIVDPACQGQGIGRKLMEAILEPLADRAVMLNATDVGAPLYRKLGFEPTGTIFQHQGVLTSVPPAEHRANERVRPMGVRDPAAIEALDRTATGLDRRKLLAAVLESARGVMLDRDNEAVGFSLLRRFGRGFAIGPTVAPDAAGAKLLISHWLGVKAGSFCRLDVSSDARLSSWLEELGLPCVGRVKTMVRGTLPPCGTGVRTFSLITQALG